MMKCLTSFLRVKVVKWPILANIGEVGVPLFHGFNGSERNYVGVLFDFGFGGYKFYFGSWDWKYACWVVWRVGSNSLNHSVVLLKPPYSPLIWWFCYFEFVTFSEMPELAWVDNPPKVFIDHPIKYIVSFGGLVCARRMRSTTCWKALLIANMLFFWENFDLVLLASLIWLA